MNDIIVMAMSTIGALFILVAAVGIIRMPDFYLRLSVTVKAATFGIGFILGAAALYFREFEFTTKVFSILFFLILTAPVSGHIIGRTAYRTGVRIWKSEGKEGKFEDPEELFTDRE